MKPRHLTVIPKTPAPDTPQERGRARIKAMPKPADIAQCSRCGGRELIEARTGVTISRGRASGGTKCFLCVLCLARGERVVVK